MVVELWEHQSDLPPQMLSVLPTATAIGSLLGPATGGFLSTWQTRHHETFGDADLLKRFPYFLPNILAAVLFLPGILLGLLFLEVSK